MQRWTLFRICGTKPERDQKRRAAECKTVHALQGWSPLLAGRQAPESEMTMKARERRLESYVPHVTVPRPTSDTRQRQRWRRNYFGQATWVHTYTIDIEMVRPRRLCDDEDTPKIRIPFLITITTSNHYTSPKSLLNSTVVLTHSLRCGCISLNLASPGKKLVMKCFAVKLADISSKCILGANLAALTTWPLRPSIRCVSAEKISAHKAVCNHKGNGRLPW